MVALLSMRPWSARSITIENRANTAIPTMTSRRSNPNRGRSRRYKTMGSAATSSVATMRQISVKALIIKIPDKDSDEKPETTVKEEEGGNHYTTRRVEALTTNSPGNRHSRAAISPPSIRSCKKPTACSPIA